MAKNYTMKEVVEIINAGTDMEAITDIGRRFPGLLYKVTKVTTKAGEDFVDLMNCMPEYLTAGKVNTVIKAGVAGNTEAADETENETEETKETAEKETSEETAVWNESMSGKQLWDILGKAGKRKLAKSTKKADLIEACKQAFGAVVEGKEEEAEVAEEAAEEESAETNPYEGKSAMELFKECKKRGIKAEAKKPAKFYADLLIKADAEVAKAEETESESDDWDEEKAEEPKKPEKKAPAKKAAKKEEADDDDDWDI